MPRAQFIACLTALCASVLGVWAAGAQAEDRYGPPPPTDMAAPAAEPAAGWLSWSNKSPPPAPARPAPTADYAQRFEARPPAPEADPVARPDRVAALPTSLYGTYPSLTPRGPAAAAPQMAAAGTPAHFYSVHRQFGLSPDPIPLPPQFFADGAVDLAAPPPPLPPHAVPGSQAATSPADTPANRARAVDLQTADSAAN